MAYILLRWMTAGLCGVLGAPLSVSAQAASDAPPALSQAHQSQLVRLVRQDCGACHGLTLRGGLGSPLLPAQLAEKPIESLVATVLDGRPATAMPPWRGLLTPQEARWIVERLQTGFPQR